MVNSEANRADRISPPKIAAANILQFLLARSVHNPAQC
jgi:hypothetical protein